MRKLTLHMFMSLDGYVAGPGGEFIPPAWSGDLETHWSGAALGAAGHILYGRTNFEFNRAFWTDMSGPAADIPHAAAMNRLPKTVVSRTLSGDPGWNGTVARDLRGAVADLKARGDGEIVCFGGAGLAQGLVAHDLIDAYRLMIVPQLYGGGLKLFEAGAPRLALTLLESRRLDTGAVILHYVREDPRD